jgi:CubicO group peptidase (beta-lactamase class C family)
MITSAAVYKLFEDRLLSSVGRHVFGPGGILGNDVTLPAAMKGLEDAQLQQFLKHDSGLPGDVPVPANCNAGGAKGNASLTARIQDTLTQYAKAHPGKALLGKPGEYNAYSNMSHIIAEAAIEKLSGRRYADYVRSRVFAPAGLTGAGPLAPALFTIGDFTGTNATSGEAGHYAADGTYAAWKATDTCGNEPPGAGAGGWAMSAVDLLRWFTSIDGKPGRVPELLTPGDQRALTTAGKATKGGDPNYASGIAVNTPVSFCGSSTSIIQGHNGGLPGTSSELWELANGYELAVIVNGSSPAGVCAGAPRIVRNLVRGPLKTVDWPDHDQF